MQTRLPLLLSLLAFFISFTYHAIAQSPHSERPNIILVLVDDMGYSDLGCYGSEIKTPHLDTLASGGIRFKQFYNTARCCPTRASLLTGLYQHQTGIGLMTSGGRWDFDFGVEGYRGQLNRRCITLAEILRREGYHTYMTGKWHLGGNDPDDLPLQRGFDRYFGTPAGASSFFKPQGNQSLYMGNDRLPPPDPTTFYTTDAYTDYAIEFIEENPAGEPFFLYLAYNAPHWPLHAKQSDIEKYVGKYKVGWDQLRNARLTRQKELGMIPEGFEMSPRDERVRPWTEVDKAQKIESDYRMAVYAAQVDCVDQNMGKLIAFLKERGEYENTLILFLSDNGASPEPHNEFGGQTIADINDPNNGGIVSYGIGWANLSNTPYPLYKRHAEEGGIRTSFIAHWPAGINEDLVGTWISGTGHILDVMPTVVEITGAHYPTMHKGSSIYPMEGHSLTPYFSKGKRHFQPTYFFEHTDNCGIRHGNWKMVSRFGEFDWKLYKLESDPIEQVNIAAKHPDIVSELAAAWHTWAARVGATPKGTRTENSYR